MFSPGHYRVTVCRRYLLVSVDPGSILWRAFFLFFCPSPFFPPPLFQLDFKSWHGFNPYQIPIFFYHSFCFLPFFFPSFALFTPPFLSSSIVFLPFSLLFSFSYSFPIPFSSSWFLFFFPFLLLFFLSFLKSLLCYGISNWFTHVQVRKLLN